MLHNEPAACLPPELQKALMGFKFTRDDLIAIHSKLCSQAAELMTKKNHDYGGREDGFEAVFANFSRVEALEICSTSQGFLVRLTDKLSRLITLTQGRKFQVAESLRDTTIDIINYAVLFYAYNYAKEQQEKQQTKGK